MSKITASVVGSNFSVLNKQVVGGTASPTTLFLFLQEAFDTTYHYAYSIDEGGVWQIQDPVFSKPGIEFRHVPRKECFTGTNFLVVAVDESADPPIYTGVAYSSDLVSWGMADIFRQAGLNSEFTPNGLATDGNGTAVAGLQMATGELAYSMDHGVTWTQATVSTTGSNIAGIGWDGDRFVAVDQLGVIFESSTGASWAVAASITGEDSGYFKADCTTEGVTYITHLNNFDSADPPAKHWYLKSNNQVVETTVPYDPVNGYNIHCTGPYITLYDSTNREMYIADDPEDFYGPYDVSEGDTSSVAGDAIFLHKGHIYITYDQGYTKLSVSRQVISPTIFVEGSNFWDEDTASNLVTLKVAEFLTRIANYQDELSPVPQTDASQLNSPFITRDMTRIQDDYFVIGQARVFNGTPGRVAVYNADTDQIITTATPSDPSSTGDPNLFGIDQKAIAVSEEYFATGSPNYPIDSTRTGKIDIFDAAGALQNTVLAPPLNGFDVVFEFGTSLAAKPDKLYVAINERNEESFVDGDSAYYVLDPQTGGILQTVPIQNSRGGPKDMVLTPDGTKLLMNIKRNASDPSIPGSTGDQNVTRIYTEDGTQLREVDLLPQAGGGTFGVTRDILAASNTKLAFMSTTTSSDEDKGVHVYDIATGELLKIIQNPVAYDNPGISGYDDMGFGRAIAFLDNLLFVGANRHYIYDETQFEQLENYGRVYIYDATTFEELQVIENPTELPDSYFGAAIAVKGNRMIVTAFPESGATAYTYILNPV